MDGSRRETSFKGKKTNYKLETWAKYPNTNSRPGDVLTESDKELRRLAAVVNEDRFGTFLTRVSRWTAAIVIFLTLLFIVSVIISNLWR